MWFVYILLCVDGSLYTGISNNPDKRFKEHQECQGASYTRSHKPVKIIYKEVAKSKSEALKREFEIKSWNRKEKISKLKLTI